MKRLALETGNHTASSTDRKAYHILFDGDGKVVRGAVGDAVLVTFDEVSTTVNYGVRVTADNVITIYPRNAGAGTLDPAAATFRATVFADLDQLIAA